ELVAEVTTNRANIELRKKIDVYRRFGVQDCIVWYKEDATIDWFWLRNGQYERLTPDDASVYRSQIFPGLWLDSAAMMRGDMAAVFKTLQTGINSSDHSAFVLKLQEGKAERSK